MVMCLRPSEASFINVAIMHPVFHRVMGILKSGKTEPEDWKMVLAKLNNLMPCAFAGEVQHRDAINDILNEFVAVAGATIAPRIIVSGTSQSDGSAGGSFNMNYKNEKGCREDADPYMENEGYYVCHSADGNGAMKKHCCPLLMLEVVGQEMGLSGAAWACGHPYVHPLSSNVPFLAIPQDVDMRLMQGHLCKALRVGFRELHEWYSTQDSKRLEADSRMPIFRFADPFCHLMEAKFSSRTRNCC
jgi:hypothetical protein